MNLKKEICDAFCEGFRISAVPIGHVITSPFTWMGDEPLVFYTREQGAHVRLEDSGSSLMQLEDIAGDLTTETRLETIRKLASEHNVNFDEETNSFYSQWVLQEDVSQQAILFLSFLNRLQDLEFLSRSQVQNAFREDLIEAIHERFENEFIVSLRKEISSLSRGYIADVTVTAEDGRNAAVFAATAEVKALEALLAAELIVREGLQTVPVLVYEDFLSSPISQRTRTRTLNNDNLRLADWSGGKEEVLEKIAANL